MPVISTEKKKIMELEALAKAESTYNMLMHDGNGLKRIPLDLAMTGLIYNNAGAHNAIYRGKYLGDHVTDEQWTEIHNGTFRDMYVGDYWVINGITWRIAAFDYWLNHGDTACTKRIIVIVPDTHPFIMQDEQHERHDWSLYRFRLLHWSEWQYWQGYREDSYQ